jgi:prophage tail gpP-like protein
MSDPRRPAQGFDLQLMTTHVPVLSGCVTRAIDAVAWAWTAEIEWQPGRDAALDSIVKPYAYSPATVTLDGTLVLTGWLYKVTPRKTAEGTTLTLEGASLTADLVDSTIPTAQFKGEWTSLGVADIAQQLVAPLGIQVKRVGVDGSQYVEKFDVVQSQPTETYAELLTRLGFQRGMLVTTAPGGQLLLTVANVNATQVAILQEGKPPVTAWGGSFDGRRRFHTYVALAQDDFGETVSGEETDSGCTPTQRRTTFVAGDATGGNAAQVAAWRRSAALADGLELRLPVDGWTPPYSSQLWEPNTIVVVQAPTLFLGSAMPFLIRETEHVYDGNGRTTVLGIVPPETYTGAAIREQWGTVAAGPPAPFVEGSLDLS